MGRSHKIQYRQKKIVFMVRDPRDTLVSYYLHCTHRRKIYHKDISSFIRDPKFGIDRLICFLNVWAINRHIPKDFMVVRYESMHENAVGELLRVVNFLEQLPLIHENARQAVEFGQFSNMKLLEQKKELNVPRMLPGNLDDPESFKVRKGKIGGYVEYLTQDDINYLTNKINSELSPFWGYTFWLPNQ